MSISPHKHVAGKWTQPRFIITLLITIGLFVVLPLMVLLIKRQMDDRSKATNNDIISKPWIISDPDYCADQLCKDDYYVRYLNVGEGRALYANVAFNLQLEYSRTPIRPDQTRPHTIRFVVYALASSGARGNILFSDTIDANFDIQPFQPHWMTSAKLVLPQGNYQAEVIVDASQVIDEVNEENNRAVQHFSVGGAPPLPDNPHAIINFPAEYQSVVVDIDKTFCLDTSTSDLPNLQRKYRLNNSAWSDYQIIPYSGIKPLICLEPPNGANQVQLQYKSPSGEGAILTRHFTMLWTCPAGPHVNYDHKSSYITILDYSLYLYQWRLRSPRADYDCTGTTGLRDMILFLYDFRIAIRNQ